MENQLRIPLAVMFYILLTIAILALCAEPLLLSMTENKALLELIALAIAPSNSLLHSR